MPYSKEQLELQAHIEAENANRKLETEKNGGFCFTTVSDLEHWAEYGVYNIAQYKHHNAAATHYDFYKEVHGIRPHWYDYSKMTVEQIEDEIQLLVKHQEYELVANDDVEISNSLFHSSEKSNELGAMFSVGAEYQVLPKLTIGANAKYQLDSYANTASFNVGTTYYF